MRLLWLPQVLRSAGLTVHTVAGWETRGADSYGPVRGITIHHTAGSLTSSVAGEIGTLLHGSSSAPAPIAQLFLARNGDWHVVASGLCFHNLVGWSGPNAGYGNDSLLGIEAQHSGGSEPWTPAQYQSYVRGVAALVRHKAPGYDVTPARVAGHKEHQPGAKSDPTFDMATFRAQVAAAVTTEQEDDMPTPQEIAKAVWEYDGIKSPWGDAKTNPHVTGGNALADTLALALEARARLDAIGKRVDLDPAELAAIKAAIVVPTAQQNAEATVEAMGALSTGALVDLLRRGLGDQRARELGAALSGSA